MAEHTLSHISKHMSRHIAGLADAQRRANDYADFRPQQRKGSYGPSAGVLRNLRAHISLKRDSTVHP